MNLKKIDFCQKTYENCLENQEEPIRNITPIRLYANGSAESSLSGHDSGLGFISVLLFTYNNDHNEI